MSSASFKAYSLQYYISMIFTLDKAVFYDNASWLAIDSP
jgi:hypothetical protein